MRPLHSTDRLAVEHAADHVRVELPAEIDLVNGRAVSQRLLYLLNSGADRLVLDLSPTVFCASDGVNALIRARIRARALHSCLVLVVPPASPIRRVLEICGVTRIIPTAPTLAEALALLPSPQPVPVS